uniref:Uncharacterized protein n=1 Tax=Romanomermis culicivorax TaxID=13658 RepID=A0A915L6E5_ROMCU
MNNNDSQLLIKLQSHAIKLSDFLRKISVKFFRSIFPPIYLCSIVDDCGRRRTDRESPKNLHENYTECLDEWADGRRKNDDGDGDEIFSWYGEENLHNLGENLLEFLRPVKSTIEKLADFRENLNNFKEQGDKNCKIDISRAVFCSLICQNSTKIRNRICISNAIKNKFEKSCSPMNFGGDIATISGQTEPEVLDDMADIRPIFKNIFQNSVVKNGPAISAAIFDYCGPLLVDERFQITNSSSFEENHPIRKKSIRRRAETSRSGSVDHREKTMFQVVSTISQDLDSIRKNWFIKLVNDSVKSLKSLTNVEYTSCSQEADISTKNASARYVAASTEIPISRTTANHIEEQRHTQNVDATSTTATVFAIFQASTPPQNSNIAQNPQNYVIEYNGGVEGSGSGELLNKSKHRKSIITDDDDYVDQQQNDDDDFSSGNRPLGENAIEREEYSSGDGQLPKIGGQQSPQDAIIEELLESSSSNDNLDDEDSVTSTFEPVLDVTPGIYAIQTVYQSS